VPRKETRLQISIVVSQSLSAASGPSRRVRDSVESNMPPTRGPPGFQWEKYEAWRGHPLLQFQKRNALPGFCFALGLFAVYVVYDKATNDGKGHH
jgi:hypothetical protein